MKNWLHCSNRAGWLRWQSLAIVALAVVFMIRGGWMISHLPELAKDTDSYAHLGMNLAKHGVFGIGYGEASGEITPTASRPPMYPLLLSLFADADGNISILAIAALNFALGLGTIGFVWALVRRAAPEHPMAAVAAVVVIGLDPLLLHFSAQTMTETPAAFLSALSCWLFAVAMESRKFWPMAGFGAVLSLAALTRTTFLPLLLPAVLIALWVKRDVRRGLVKQFASALLPTLSLILGALLVLGPWAVRNQRIFGRPFATTTHGGYALAAANSPDFLIYVCSSGRAHGPWSLSMFDASISREYPAQLGAYDPDKPWINRTPAQELAMDEFLYGLGIEWLRSDLGTSVFLAADRVFQFWNPLPNKTVVNETGAQWLVRLGCGGWYVICFASTLAALIAGGRLSRRPSLVWALVVCLVFTAIHLFFWTNIRMRAPVMPCVASFASVGFIAVVRFIRSRHKKPAVETGYPIAATARKAEI